MNTISAEQFNKLYGQEGTSLFPPPSNSRPTISQAIANSFKGGVDQAKQGFQELNQPSNNPLSSIGHLVEGAGKIGAGAIGAAFSPLAPITDPLIAKPIKAVADKIAENPTVQKFADSKVGQAVAKGAENVANYATIAGTVGGILESPKVATTIVDTTGKVITDIGKGGKKALKPLKSAVADTIPSSDRIINSQITKAFDLTQGDVKNISLSTGNDVGEFVANNNLIGKNVADSHNLIKDFYKQNYNIVRDEIGKVTKVYKQSEVPRYTEALTELQKQTEGVPGLQNSSAEINNLLKKKNLTLEDVQRTKELMDDHFNLYKVTGDVKEGVAKEGLSNIRKDLKGFIEKQVKDETGADIKQLNNNVQTARSISDAIEYRSTRGLTRANLSLSDLSLFGGGSMAGGPLTGAALVFAKRLLQNPNIQLKVAGFLKNLSDAKQMKIKASLEAGKVPKEIDQLAK